MHNPIQGTPFTLFHIKPADDILGSVSPNTLLIALGSIAIIVLGITGVVLHSQMKNIALQVRLDESHKTNKKIEQKNLTLHEEMKERKIAEIKLKSTHEQLLHSEKLSAIGKLSASFAHEFNNPLQGVLNIISNLEKGAKLDVEEHEMAQLAIGECYRMKKLIENLRDFTQRRSQNMELLDMRVLFNSVLMLGKKNLESRKIAIMYAPPSNFPLTYASADQMKQVFLNLMQNAAEACQEKDTITVNLDFVDNNIFITVEDTGSGITNGDIHQIFNPFFTTKQNLKGTGLGLSISYGIIKNHGGTLSVTSEIGKGSIFTIVLPILDKEFVTNEEKYPFC